LQRAAVEDADPTCADQSNVQPVFATLHGKRLP
jgi:hypothetical protein